MTPTLRDLIAIMSALPEGADDYQLYVTTYNHYNPDTPLPCKRLAESTMEELTVSADLLEPYVGIIKFPTIDAMPETIQSIDGTVWYLQADIAKWLPAPFLDLETVRQGRNFYEELVMILCIICAKEPNEPYGNRFERKAEIENLPAEVAYSVGLFFMNSLPASKANFMAFGKVLRMVAAARGSSTESSQTSTTDTPTPTNS